MVTVAVDVGRSAGMATGAVAGSVAAPVVAPPDPTTSVLTYTSWQTKIDGQSASVAQVVAFGLHVPGNSVHVVQVEVEVEVLVRLTVVGTPISMEPPELDTDPPPPEIEPPVETPVAPPAPGTVVSPPFGAKPGSVVVTGMSTAVVAPVPGTGLALVPPVAMAVVVAVAVPVLGAGPVHMPKLLGSHVKPSPHSESVLHGSCHVYAHAEVVTVVHSGGMDAGQSVPFTQSTATPPVHDSDVVLWHTIPFAQSLSVAHAFGAQ